SSSSTVCGQPVISGRIVGGDDATNGAWPWQVAVLRSYYFICGGSLIDKEWVLSAAHCFYNATNPDEYLLIFGANQLLNLSPDVVVRRVKRIILHYDYNGPVASSGDIALLQLSFPVDFTNNIHPICLPESSAEFYVNTNCWVTGWGNTQFKERDTAKPKTLQEVKLPLITWEICNIYYNMVPIQGLTWNPMKADMLCAGYQIGGKGPCQGDSGGPLVCNVQGSWFQAGIVSWSVGCAQRNYPSVYASVPYYAKWISAGLEGRDPNSAALVVSYLNSTVSRGKTSNLALQVLVVYFSYIHSATNPDDYFLVFGAYQLSNLSTDKVVRDVNRIILHYDYIGTYDSSGDIALLQLSSPMEFTNNILPICLPESSAEFYANTNCWVTGWGNTQTDGEKCSLPCLLRPLVCKVQGSWFQAGIVSWGRGCALHNYPGVYTSVPYYTKWISATLEGSNNSNSGSQNAPLLANLEFLLLLALLLTL
uniref:Peptidase S1 domain-containing protein n=1 Tax=Anolis carolinensis TaxID=28377 RepID=H9GC52_ANOCA